MLKSEEDKVNIVRKETAKAKSLYVGDGINDAPAMVAATVGMAIGQNSDVRSSAAGVVVMDSSLTKVDEFMHISRRMRIIAEQSAIGGMVLSMLRMGFAATGQPMRQTCRIMISDFSMIYPMRFCNDHTPYDCESVLLRIDMDAQQ